MRVAGLGCRRGAPLDALQQALAMAAAQGGAPDALATIPAREAEARALADAMTLPLRLVRVEGIATPTRSQRILARYGTGSVAEAAALVAAGPGARITVARMISTCGRATCAIAESGEPA